MFQVELPCNKVPNGFSPFSGTPKPASRWWYMYIYLCIYPIKYPILDPPPDFMPIRCTCVPHMFIWKSASTSSGFWNFSSFSPWKSPKIAPFPQPSAWFPPVVSRRPGHIPGLPLGADSPGGRRHGVPLGEARGAAVRLQRKGVAPRCTGNGVLGLGPWPMKNADSPGELWDNLWKIIGKMTILSRSDLMYRTKWASFHSYVSLREGTVCNTSLFGGFGIFRKWWMTTVDFKAPYRIWALKLGYCSIWSRKLWLFRGPPELITQGFGLRSGESET